MIKRELLRIEGELTEMAQKYIRPYNGDSYSVPEGAELVKELDDRTKTGKAGLDSLDKVAAAVLGLLNTGRYSGYYQNVAALKNARPNPRNGDRALVGQLSGGIYAYHALNGQWHAETSLQLVDDLTERVENIENEISPVPNWAEEAITKLDF